MPQPYDYSTQPVNVDNYFNSLRQGREDRAQQETATRQTALQKYMPGALNGEAEARAEVMKNANPDQQIALQNRFDNEPLQKIEQAMKMNGAITQLLSQVRDGDRQGFEAAKQRAAQIGIPMDQMGHLTVADLPRLRAESGQAARELDIQFKQAQIKAQQANAAQSYAAADASMRSGQGGGSGLGNAAMQRAALAQQFGIDPNSDAGKKYILTGQLPASLSPTDKKAIQEADQMVMATQQGMAMLKQAEKLNPKAAGGFGMGLLSDAFAQIGDETALNTRDLENVLQSNVLPQLKAIFGGAITEGERQILLDLQGSASKTVEERRRIIERSIAAANARLGFYRDQAQDLRGGTYYSPTRAQPQTTPTPPATGSTQPPSNGGFTVRKVR